MTGKHWPEDDDRVLVRALGAATRPDIPALAKRLGRTEVSVRARLSLLRRRALPRRGGPTRDWGEAEIATLRDLIGWRNAEQIAKRLGRTPTAVRIKAKRLGLHWVKGRVECSANLRPAERHQHLGYTAREVAAMLGIPCAKTVAWWIEEGWLCGTKRPTRYGKHTIWRIHAEAIEAFLREYRWVYDPARIADRGWAAFVAALPPAAWVGTAEAARLLPYTTNSVAQLIRKGDLAAEKHGPNWRISMAAIRQFEPPPYGYGRDDEIRERLTTKRRTVLASRKTKGWTYKRSVAAQAVAS